MAYSQLLFDFDNTLVDFSHSAYLGLQDTFKEYNVEWTEKNYQLYKSINHGVWLDFEKGLITTEDIRKKRFTLFLESLNMTHIDGFEMNAFYLEQIVVHPKVLDHTLDALEKLSKHYTLTIITNGLKEVQRKRIEKHGLEKYFPQIFVSDEINLAKPDPLYFKHVYDRIEESDKSKILVIGDNLNSDIGGAQSFGFRTCWYNPQQTENSTDISPDHQIEKLTDLIELLPADR